jgi:hypothetical protein
VVVSYWADLEGTVVTCLSQSQIIWLAEMTYAGSLQKVCGCVGSTSISAPKSKHLKTLFMRFPNYRNEISGCEDVNKSEAKKYSFLEVRFLS